jgi:hypothetical protein
MKSDLRRKRTLRKVPRLCTPPHDNLLRLLTEVDVTAGSKQHAVNPLGLKYNRTLTQVVNVRSLSGISRCRD